MQDLVPFWSPFCPKSPLPSKFAVHLLLKWLKCCIFNFVTVNSFRVLTLLIAILVYPKYVMSGIYLCFLKFIWINKWEIQNWKKSPFVNRKVSFWSPFWQKNGPLKSPKGDSEWSPLEFSTLILHFILIYPIFKIVSFCVCFLE